MHSARHIGCAIGTPILFETVIPGPSSAVAFAARDLLPVCPLEAREAGGALRIVVALADAGLQVRGGIVVGPLQLDLNLMLAVRAAARSRFLARRVGARFRVSMELVAAITSFRVGSRT